MPFKSPADLPKGIVKAKNNIPKPQANFPWFKPADPKLVANQTLIGKFALLNNIVYLIEGINKDNPDMLWCTDNDGADYELCIHSFDHIYD